MNTQASGTAVTEIEIHAPAERIFEALTDPQQIMKWWGKGEQLPKHVECDVRVGGAWLMHVEPQPGQRFEIRGVYREIDPPRALSFTWQPNWDPTEGESLVRFEVVEKGDACLVRITHSGLSEARAKQYGGGWNVPLHGLKDFLE